MIFLWKLTLKMRRNKSRLSRIYAPFLENLSKFSDTKNCEYSMSQLDYVQSEIL